LRPTPAPHIAAEMASRRNVAIFDLGGVGLQWSPRRIGKLF
jgi:hypothetical protein